MPCNLSSQTLPEKASRRPYASGRTPPAVGVSRASLRYPVCAKNPKRPKRPGNAGTLKYTGETNQEIRVQGLLECKQSPRNYGLRRRPSPCSPHGTFGDATRRLARHADARTNRQVDIQPPDTSLTSLARADTPDGHPRVAHSRGSSRTGKNLPSEARGDGCRYAPRQPGNPALHRVPGRIGARNRARRCQTPRGS